MCLHVFFGNKNFIVKATAFVVISFLSFKLNAFEPDNIIAFDLSATDKKKFEGISCVKFVGAEIEKIFAQTIKGLNYPTAVFVDCKPHNTLDGYPLRISISCRSTDGKWGCEYPALEVLTNMSGQRIVVSSDPKEIYGAIEAAKYLDKNGTFISSKFLKSSSEANICSVSEFKNSRWHVSCNESWWFDLTRLCAGDKCDFKIIDEGQVLH
jgi:hypothetical protein